MLESKLKQLDDIELENADVLASPLATAIATTYLDTQDTAVMRRHRRRQSKDPKSPSTQHTSAISLAKAIESGDILDAKQIGALSSLLESEIESLSTELKGKCSTTSNYYPQNLNLKDALGYIPLPTVVYELEYPRQERIDWFYVAEKAMATFGVIAVMTLVSQAYIYPIVMQTVAMKASGLPLAERIKEFPWILSDLLFPFMLEYLLAWYVIWECTLNLLAELTLFADRGFYADWWNSTSWDQFARDWNVPVHNFLLRHVYHSSISAWHVSKPTATLVTFLLSAVVHELVMYCIFKKLRGYLMVLQMSQLPLVMLARTRMMRERKILGNIMFWLGIFTAPSLLCSLYLII